MTQFVLSVVLMGLPHLLGATETKECEGVRVVAVAADGDVKVEPIVLTAVSTDAGPVVVAQLTPLVLAAGEEGAAHVVRVEGKRSSHRGWLGISIGDVPEALAAQLDTEGEGVLVLDVVKGSPADRAGIEVHDIIVSLGEDQEVTDVRSLTRAVGTFEVGDHVDVIVLRDGKETAIELELGSRPATVMEWKVDLEPVEEIEERVKTRGRIIGHGPSGNVFIKDLGDLDALKDLPVELRAMIPDVNDHSVRVFVDGNETRVSTEVRDDGSAVAVSQENGKITVTRTDAVGEVDEAQYDGVEELQEADPEAFKMLSRAGHHTLMHLPGHDIGDFTFDINVTDGDFSEWREVFELQLGKAHEAMQEARESAHAALAEAMERLNDGRSEPGLAWTPRVEGLLGEKGHLHRLLQGGKPRWSFEAHADGSITVTTRKGDTQVSREFSSEADLAQRDPALFERYDKTISAADAE